ncbi:Dynein light chain type 1 family protein [Theobroma cacao]|uniref:Dynein light chain 1, cytoplasmic n=1 Tax=Theobroma cacao TaxID=3641 RepID=A0A061EWA9_THECC|nr:Dynein light chain type 1 family protein [Theobroma cacao]
MSTEEAKRSITGALTVKPTTDDRKPSPVTTTASAAATGKKVIIKSADMKDDMQKEAVDIAISAFEKNNVEKDVAEHIKKEFDKRHGPTWHCIVGRNFGVCSGRLQPSNRPQPSVFVTDGYNRLQSSVMPIDLVGCLARPSGGTPFPSNRPNNRPVIGFGSYVTHETNHFVYFYLDQKAVLLFKSG